MLSFIITQLLVVINLVPIAAVHSGYQESTMPKQAIVVSSSVYSQVVLENPVTTARLYGDQEIPILSDSNKIVNVAMSLVGVPYTFSGSSPSGFDCSGFTSYVYASAGIPIPHSAHEQKSAGKLISENEAMPGDLVVWPGHVGIWLGPGVMIDAAREGTVVDVRSIWGSPEFVTFR